VAWTAAGGDILFIEVTVMPGKGGLTMTGQMGDVMQESAQTAMSYTRSIASSFGVREEVFENTDVHIHIPEGAVPKDGPSAGVAMVTALLSAYTERPIRRDVGMTGEITLRGRILPVGGIREKALAARRVGMKTLILPKKNDNDLESIPKRLRQDMDFLLVERMHDVFDAALIARPTNQSSPTIRSVRSGALPYSQSSWRSVQSFLGPKPAQAL
jgi:ATP-dependent Lon protease